MEWSVPPTAVDPMSQPSQQGPGMDQLLTMMREMRQEMQLMGRQQAELAKQVTELAEESASELEEGMLEDELPAAGGVAPSANATPQARRGARAAPY